MLPKRKCLTRKYFLAVIGIFCFFTITFIYKSSKISDFEIVLTPSESYDELIPVLSLPILSSPDPTLPILSSSDSSLIIRSDLDLTNQSKIAPGYLVWSPQCKIFDHDPFEKESMKNFKRQEFKPCSNQKPLTTIEQNFEENVVRLIFHSDLKSDYSTNTSTLLCWYNEITRDNEASKPDKTYKLKESQYFNESIDLPSSIESIIVQCSSTSKKSKKSKKKTETVYKNAHTFIRRTPERARILNDFKILYPQKKPLSVLMIGADSISRLNFLRTMPNTAEYVHQNDWFELEGYNKNGYATDSNLMAILTGIDLDSHNPNQGCKMTLEGYEKCKFLWKYFKQSGYATAFAEDGQNIHTFNYCRDGFLTQPTMHYLRPFTMAAEELAGNSKRFQCLLYQQYADYIYQNAIDFATAYKDESYFGLFWTNTFSHEDVNEPSSMDDKMKSYFEQMEEKGILNSSAVIFFSDHGIRFGSSRMTSETGWLEESLPFMFIWLPEWFKDEHPDFVESLKVNRNRLTTTYDIHMTLKHILELSGRVGTLDQSEGCPKCQSLFREVPWNRSCVDAGIQVNYCGCSDYKLVKKSDEDLEKYANIILDAINNYVTKNSRKFNLTTWQCAKLTLKSPRTVSCSESTVTKGKYLVKFTAHPSDAVFEAVILEHEGKSLEKDGKVSRLNKYGNDGNCVDDRDLRHYCFCEKKTKLINN